MTAHSVIDKSKFFEVVVTPMDCDALVLKKEVTLYIDDVPGNVYVLWPELSEYGTGIDLSDALTDLFGSVLTFHEFLKSNEHRLSPALRGTLREFNEVIDGRADYIPR